MAELGHVCKCTNCENLLNDENPQVDAKEFELTGKELDMVQLTEPNEGSFEDYYFWACPVCETDSYLMDIE